MKIYIVLEGYYEPEITLVTHSFCKAEEKLLSSKEPVSIEKWENDTFICAYCKNKLTSKICVDEYYNC